MGPDEYGICVVSGSDARRGPLYVDAYVYMWGGRNVARFSAARREARAWIKQASG